MMHLLGFTTIPEKEMSDPRQTSRYGFKKPQT